MKKIFALFIITTFMALSTSALIAQVSDQQNQPNRQNQQQNQTNRQFRQNQQRQFNMPNPTPEQMAQMRKDMVKRMRPVQFFSPLNQQMIETITPTLGLTADQQASTDRLFTALTKKLNEIKGKTEYNQDLLDEMVSTKTTPDKVYAISALIIRQESELLNYELQTWMEFEKLLTKEQQTALWNMMTNMGNMTGLRAGTRQGVNRNDPQRQNNRNQPRLNNQNRIEQNNQQQNNNQGD